MFFCSIIAYFKFLLNFSIITAPFIPAFSAIRRNGAKIAREIIIAPISSSSLNYFLPMLQDFLINELKLPPPGTIPSSTAARVALIASSNRNFYLSFQFQLQHQL
jgi:hypothetical protein